ncbi:phage baseplate protein [uncultured Acidaminococcus sp.]|uniref:phage baseplate protein n=1 Tax=uncultured Acidaminococcus sp. TaxID=352152 RepID=UPI00259715E7|nr:phage tail protein [uncultured Acidaminococcus sp.]
MAEFHQCVTTKQGLNLIALSRVNKCPLVFTKMAIGDRRPTDTSTISAMTALVDEKLTSDITSLKKIKNTDTTEGRYAAFGKFSNSTLATGFHISEVGLWAKVESSYYTGDSWDGYTGDAVLFCYGYADEGKTDWLPSKDTPMTPQEVGIYTSVGDAETVSVHVSDTQTVGEAEFQAHLTDVNAHSDFKGCTSTANGQRGFVPRPMAGQDNEYYLNADGTWKQVKQRSVKDLIDILYPVGYIITLTGDQNPNTLWAGTTWERYAAGRVLMGAGSYLENGVTYTYTNGATGGEVKHPLSVDEMPSHGHSASCSTAGAHYHGTYGDVYSNTNKSMGVYDSSSNHGGLSGFDWDNVLAKTTTDGNHAHTITIGATGGNGPHENRMPYQVVSFWRRTA